MKKETMTLLCLFRVLFCVGCGKADPLTAVSRIAFPKCTMSETTGGGFPGTIRFELEGSV